MKNFHLFPFHLVEKGSRIILYGAGHVMRTYMQQLETIPYCEVLFAVDRNYIDIKTISGVNVLSPETILTSDYSCVVVSVGPDRRESVLKDLATLEISNNKIVCADYLSLVSNITAESIVVKSVFDRIKIDKPSYIDCGAYHPLDASNTALFYNAGSRGINIEANPQLIEAFFRERPSDININVGIDIKRGVSKFYLYEQTSLSTFSDRAVAFNKEIDRGTPCATIQLQVETLNDIIDKYNGGTFPDFLDIDIEGLDIAVLESCDFTKSSPKVICAEVGVNADEIMAGKDCEGAGYLPYCRIESNTIYLRKDLHRRILPICD